MFTVIVLSQLYNHNAAPKSPYVALKLN